MSRFLRLLIALAIAAPALVSMAGPAVACSCVSQPARKVLATADAVVAAHVVGEQPIGATTTDSIVAVDGVYQGDVDATIVVRSDIGFGGASSCAVLYPVGSKVDPLVLHRLDDGTYQTSICAFLSRAEVVGLVGAARPPPPQPSATPTSSPPPVATEATGLSWPAVLGGLLLAVVAIALLLRRSGRRSKRRRRTPVQELQASAASAGRTPNG